jgi:hypothetical protein
MKRVEAMRSDWAMRCPLPMDRTARLSRIVDRRTVNGAQAVMVVMACSRRLVMRYPLTTQVMREPSAAAVFAWVFVTPMEEVAAVREMPKVAVMETLRYQPMGMQNRRHRLAMRRHPSRSSSH